MKILFITSNNEIWKEKKKYLKARYPQISFYDTDQRDRIEIMRDVDVIIGTPKEHEIDIAEKLRLIIMTWVGIDSLPIDKIVKRNIKVMNNHANSQAVAEKSLALCLALLGKVVFFDERMRRGVWGSGSRYSAVNRRWTSLFNKRVSIIGYGNIGREMVKLLEPFNCRILGFKKNKSNYENINITYDLKDALEFGEIIFFFLPLTEETKNLINDENKLLLRDKFIVNTGRGEVINEDSLYKLLESGLLKGAALDTWYRYPANGNIALPSKYPIHMYKNVVISPHCASDTYEAQEMMADETVENFINYIEGRELRNLVDLSRKY
ncbi:MAG: hypothetical protein PWQ77_918 [Kosmotogales bacterium]|nr:hypothetical protein [Kosmotogales bacterium]